MHRLVSIILPVYNGALFIQSAVDSVIHQTHTDWELLIIDDGSRDNTADILKSFTDSRITCFYSSTNKGAAAARNIGLANMKGNFFCFLDADDALPPRSLESRLNVFKNDESVTFADGRVDYYDRTLTRKLKSWAPDFHGKPLAELLMLSGKVFFGPSWMVKKLSNVEYAFNEGLTHAEDLLFYINLARGGGVYSFSTETVLHYRTGHTSAMTDIKGLGAGYQKVYEELLGVKDIPSELISGYRRKAKGIMIKLYAKRGQLLDALKLFLE